MDVVSEQKVLVVDDNDDVRRLVRKVLESSGYQVIEAASGQEALALTSSYLPDLVLMDVRLPGAYDGLETTRRLKLDERTQDVPVVALTASVLEKDKQRALSAGCSDFIGKPVDIEHLREVIKQHIAIKS